MPKISVIIPIYNALNDLKILLDSILKNFNFNLGEVILVNDHSDEQTSNFLNAFCVENKQIKLLNNEENLGFVKTCNKGMKEANGDVITLLNSDTIIPQEFCERIIECFKHNKKIGIASPISSHTYSYFIPMPENYTVYKMNALLNKKHKHTYPLIPAAEGFCFCIRKDVIEQQGYLDEVWGKGYHEEVDYAYRAITNGWKNVLIDNLYVYHKRHASFGVDNRAKLIAQNNPEFFRRWSGFRENYEKEIGYVNPIYKIRKKLFPQEYPSSCKYKPLEKLFSIKNSNDKKYKIITILGMQIKHRKRTKSDNAKYEAHVKWMESGYQTKFVPYKNNAFVENCAVKPIAFYLPQFHSFKENEDWYGRGFTEWTNVTRATPQYTGHYQPHLPIDVGFYNLNTNDAFYRQIEIAKNYGIYGFSFYYYWFSGRKLMEKPIYNYLNDKNLNFPFCLCWACENWSKLWDGGNREVLVESDLRENDFEQFWNDFLPFAMDKRYIRINNKPLLIMYRPNKFDKEILKIFVKIIRKKAIKAGFDGLYIIWAITNDLTTTSKEIDIKEFDFDACLEFPPHGIRDNIDKSKNVKQKRCEKYLRPDFNGVIYDIKNWILNKKYEQPLFENTNIYRGVFPMWDNAARKAQSGCLIFDGMTPELYRQWLGGIIKWTKENRPKNEQYIFINAWNEWAEGAHLEPDYKHGYAYLQKTYEALNEEENTSYIS